LKTIFTSNKQKQRILIKRRIEMIIENLGLDIAKNIFNCKTLNDYKLNYTKILTYINLKKGDMKK